MYSQDELRWWRHQVRCCSNCRMTVLRPPVLRSLYSRVELSKSKLPSTQVWTWRTSWTDPHTFSTFTCSKKFKFLIVSDNDMRRTGSLVWVYMPFRESDNWPEHGWLHYARWRCSPLNKEPHPVELYLFLQSFWKDPRFSSFGRP